MLTIDDARYLRIQSGAVALGPRIEEIVSRALADGARNIFFLGAGGAAILMHPAQLLLERRSSFASFKDISAELVIAGHAQLGPKSLVVIPSLSGTTKESVAALDYCKARGAEVIALTGHADSPIGRGAHHALVNFAEDDSACESFHIQALLIALAVLKARGECPDHARIMAELQTMPHHLLAVKKDFALQAEALAERLKGETWHIITAAGYAWPQAWYYSMCILEEMQWIRTRPIHAADFFHGTLELVEKGVSVILMKGEDEYRPVADRVEKFLPQFTGKITVLDTAACAMPGLSREVRGLMGPAILASLLERLLAWLAVKRDHPLGQRRYYNKVPY